jgi:hypothetical protein
MTYNNNRSGQAEKGCTLSLFEEEQGLRAFNKSKRKEVWTREYLVDRLFFEMVEIHDEGEGWDDYQNVGQKKKYYDRGADAIKMAAGRPPPIFVINISDLTWRLKLELSELSRDTLDYVVRQSIERICENVNSKLYHLTLKRSLGWRFEN